MIPKVLLEVANYLKELDFSLHTGNDARMDSNQSEAKIVQLLQNANRWEIYSPNVASGNNRSWYDVKINGHYVDIKISQCKSNDNTNAKMAIYYFLTGITPDKISPAERKFFADMKENESPNESRDYYYLIVNKQDLSDIFVTSLKNLSHAAPNLNNLPFQANWDKCRKPTQRNWKEAKQFLLENWAKSVESNIIKHNESILRAYPEFFNIKVTKK